MLMGWLDGGTSRDPMRYLIYPLQSKVALISTFCDDRPVVLFGPYMLTTSSNRPTTKKGVCKTTTTHFTPFVYSLRSLSVVVVSHT